MHTFHLLKIKSFFVLMTSLFLAAVLVIVQEDMIQAFKTEIKSNVYRSEYNKLSDELNIDISPTVPINNSGIPILLYHGIVDNPDRFSISLKNFKDQIFYLKMFGYETITIDDLNLYLEGKGNLPNRPVMITFDDGRIDSYLESDPVIRAVNFNAVMYVAAGPILSGANNESTYYISGSDLVNMVKSYRWEVESHALQNEGGMIDINQETKGNFLSNKKWLFKEYRFESDAEFSERIKNEIVQSKNLLDDRFNLNVSSFAYPFGDYGQQSINYPESKEIIKNYVSAYKTAFKQVWSGDGVYTYNYGDSDRHLLNRFEVPTNWTGSQLVSFLESAKDKHLPYSDSFQEQSGWQRNWGNQSFIDQKLRLKSSSTSTGAFVFLDGTRLWSNYLFRVDSKIINGSHISLIGRYRDNQNYLACVFNENYVKIEEYHDGVILKRSESRNLVNIDRNLVNLGILVNDDYVECSINNKVVVFSTIHSGIGGIGLKIWDSKLGNADVIFDDVAVTGKPW